MEAYIEKSFDTLKSQYNHLGWPTELIGENTDFTIFSLKAPKQSFPFKSPGNRLNFFVFGFIKNSDGQYVVDDQKFNITPGTVYFTNPGHFRSFQYNAIDEACLITLSESFLKEHVHPDVYEEFPFLLSETFPAKVLSQSVFYEFETIYTLLLKEYHSRSIVRNRLLGSLFVVLLLKFKEHLWPNYNAIYEDNRGSEIVRQFKTILEKHYRDLSSGAVSQVFRLQDYGDSQNLHPNYLNTVIKSKTGKAIGTWIAEKNIIEAKSLLQNSKNSIKEISFRLGFSDTAHFSKYFKKHTYEPPTKYRKGKS